MSFTGAEGDDRERDKRLSSYTKDVGVKSG